MEGRDHCVISKKKQRPKEKADSEFLEDFNVMYRANASYAVLSRISTWYYK
jgi:hypothetical protein